MIKLISSKAACILCKDEKHTDNYELYEYAIYILLSSAFHMATVIVLGLIFNLLTESLVFYFSFIAIRKFAGGYHAKTPVRCYLFSIIIISLILGFIKMILVLDLLFATYGILILGFISVIIINILSPLDTKNAPLNNKEKIIYKKIVMIITFILFIVSTILVIKGNTKLGVPILEGIIMSALILAMRKHQKH